MSVDQREKNLLKILGCWREAIRRKTSLGQEGIEVAAVLLWRRCDQHVSTVQTSIFAPRLLLEQGQSLLCAFKLYRVFALSAGQLSDGFIRDELAGIDDRDARTNLLDLAQQVAGKEDGFALTREPVQQITHLDNACGIESVGRLVKDKQVRIVEQGDPHAQALFHSERVCTHTILLPRLQPDLLQNNLDALVRHAAKDRAHGPQVLSTRHHWDRGNPQSHPAGSPG